MKLIQRLGARSESGLRSPEICGNERARTSPQPLGGVAKRAPDQIERNFSKSAPTRRPGRVRGHLISTGEVARQLSAVEIPRAH